jgi:hypothetical protein
MIYPRLGKVGNGQRMSVELVNGLIKRTEYAADLLRQYKLVGIPGLFNGTTISAEELGLSRDLPDIVGTATIGGINFGFRLLGAGLRDPNTKEAQGEIFSAPNSSATFFAGADGSDIVGSATTNQGVKGFLLQGSTYTFFTMPSVPSSTLTEARGVRAGQIVGLYRRGPFAVGSQRGFLFNGSTFSDIFVPGSFATNATGIQGSNIVGSFNFPSLNNQGFIYNGSTFTFLSAPGSTTTLANGIDGINIVGSCVIDGISKGYYYNYISGQFTIFEVPGSISTTANGIKDTTIVGQTVIGGITKAFILAEEIKGGGTFFRTFSIPGATSTRAFDLV